jgi:hypothetical protein
LPGPGAALATEAKPSRGLCELGTGSIRRFAPRNDSSSRKYSCHCEFHTGLAADLPWMKRTAVTAGKAGVREHRAGSTDSGFRRNDGKERPDVQLNCFSPSARKRQGNPVVVVARTAGWPRPLP